MQHNIRTRELAYGTEFVLVLVTNLFFTYFVLRGDAIMRGLKIKT